MKSMLSAMVLVAGLGTGGGALGSLPADTDGQRIDYAEALAQAGLNDYSETVLATVKNPSKGQSDRIEALRFKNLLATNRPREATAILEKTAGQDSLHVWQMKLAFADSCFAWNKTAECRRVYDTFFKRFPSGPDAEFNLTYRDAAYRYGQMLETMGDRPAALAAYQNALKAKLEEPERRQVLAETGRTMLKLAEALPRTEQARYLKEVDKVSEELTWKQDLWFGHGIVMAAHVKLMQGNATAAMDLLRENMDTLEEIDRQLREESRPAK